MRTSILTSKRAKRLRREMTEPEVILWSRLRKRLPDAPVFRRQHPVGPYILDFYCAAAKLVVEIDGAMHGEPGQIEHDRRRDAWLTSQGLTVHRVSAGWVYEDADHAAPPGVRAGWGKAMNAFVPASGAEPSLAPSTTLRVVPLPRCAGEEK